MEPQNQEPGQPSLATADRTAADATEAPTLARVPTAIGGSGAAAMRARWRRALAVTVRWRSELVRQTWLYALAVLGPFLLLGLFAVGFRFAAFRPTGILVTPVGSPDAATISHLPYVKGLNANITIKSITTDQRAALAQLRDGDVDMVIELPSTPAVDVAHGERATLSIYVNVVNPLLRIALYNAVNQQIAGVNDEAIAAAVSTVQDQTRSLLPELSQLNNSMQAIRPTDPPGTMVAKLEAVRAQLVKIRANAQEGQVAQSGTAADIYYAVIISQTNQSINAIDQTEVQIGQPHQSGTSLSAAQKSVKSLDDFLQQLNAIPARTIAIPFTARITNLAVGSDNLTNFYGPAALALLLQHLAITLAALSLVQERQLGAIETLTTSPASAGELLFGRFLFYGLVTFITGLVLTALIVFGLHVPFVGSPLLYLAVLALLIWASTAAGFCIALVTRTDAQAMQSIMLLLVGAIFFSGFVGPLRALSMPIVGLAYIFPLTYGINALDDIMLLGTSPTALDFVGLIALGTVLSALAWGLFRRELAAR